MLICLQIYRMVKHSKLNDIKSQTSPTVLNEYYRSVSTLFQQLVPNKSGLYPDEFTSSFKSYNWLKSLWAYIGDGI